MICIQRFGAQNFYYTHSDALQAHHNLTTVAMSKHKIRVRRLCTVYIPGENTFHQSVPAIGQPLADPYPRQ